MLALLTYLLLSLLRVCVIVLKPVAHAKVELSASSVLFVFRLIQEDPVIKHNRAERGLNPYAEAEA